MQPGNPGQDPYGEQPPQGGQPSWEPPQYGQPPYGQQPESGQPQYGQPQQPQYGQPQYGQQTPYSQQHEWGQSAAQWGQQPQYGYGAPAGQPSNTMGLLSMIFGIAGIPLICCFGIGIPLGIAAIVLGVLGKKKADQGLATNRGQAQAGFICGIAAVAIGIILIILNIALKDVNLPTQP